MSRILGVIKKATLSEIFYESNDKVDSLPIADSKVWIRITYPKNYMAIRYITKIDVTNQKITLDSILPIIPPPNSKFDINSNIDLSSGQIIEIKAGSTSEVIKLVDTAAKMNKIYDNYWVLYNNQVRNVVEYTNNTLVLDHELLEVPKEKGKLLLIHHFFNDYIMFGVIDFTNLLGMDFSGLIDSIGGIFNFQIGALAVILLCCICCICISLIIVKTGGKGSRNYKSQPPIVIQLMPMQTQPYPFNNSPFPRDT